MSILAHYLCSYVLNLCSLVDNGSLISRTHLIISHTLAIVPDHLSVFQSDQSIQEISRTSDFPPYSELGLRSKEKTGVRLTRTDI